MKNQIQNQDLKNPPSPAKKPFFGVDTIAWLLIIGASLQLLGALFFVDWVYIIICIMGIVIGIGLLKRQKWFLYGFILLALYEIGQSIYILYLYYQIDNNINYVYVFAIIVLAFFVIYLLKKKDQFAK